MQDSCWVTIKKKKNAEFLKVKKKRNFFFNCKSSELHLILHSLSGSRIFVLLIRSKREIIFLQLYEATRICKYIFENIKICEISILTDHACFARSILKEFPDKINTNYVSPQPRKRAGRSIIKLGIVNVRKEQLSMKRGISVSP